LSVNAFVAHAVFPNDTWRRFCRNNINTIEDKVYFDKFWVTNSIPSVTSVLPIDDVFEVLDLLPQILEDIDSLNNS
jgi:hypothetical protein